VIYVTRLLHGLWGLFSWAIFLIFVVLSLLVVTFVPGLERRQRWTTKTSRGAFIFSGVPVEVNGLEHLPDGHCVVVANHASYVDGPLLKGYLPGRFSFVIKGELRKIPVVHFLLRRAGSKFVERFTAAGSTRDARQIVKAAQDGQSLVFFPEGTFIKEAGISKFRAGAFSAAIKGGMPVVPVAIFGTRRMMSAGQVLPRPGSIRIEILPPIPIDDPAFADNRQLAEAARQRILGIIDEPDLAD
jgi:1-acyl-sn-glycerol-3-phosphate acyltransferase